MKHIINWSKGNPGALDFLIKVYKGGANLSQSATIDAKLRQCTSIRGTNLYVLYSDLCGRDISKVVQLCMKCPDKVLEEACSRQDYTGIELIKEYLN